MQRATSWPSRFIPTDQYEKRSVEGWTVYVNKDLLADGMEVGVQAPKLLETKLAEVARVVPERACEELRRVPIWLGVDDGTGPFPEYHPGREWLQANGYNPDKAKAAEIGNASRFLELNAERPGLVLHVLAFAYYDRVLGSDHEGINAAFQAAKEGGRYEKGADALENEYVYFAEGTVAFFGTNHTYPFVRDELRRHDPKLFELLEEVWRFRGGAKVSSLRS